MNRSSVGSPRSHEVNRGLALILVLVVALVPLWMAEIPPLLDYHNHLARQFILASLPNSEYFQSFYQANWQVIPYLAMDAIVQLLAKLMPTATAGKVFLSITLLLLASAPLALNHALFGRLTPVALLGLLMVHNTTLTLGFVNYLFAVGFAICLISLWIGLRDDRRRVRLLVFPLLSSLLFFSHLVGFMIYGVTAGAYELGRHIERVRGRTPRAPLLLDSSQWIRLISLGAQLAIPLVTFWVFGPVVETGGQNTYGGIWRKLELLGGMFSYLIPPYIWTLDRILAIGLPAAVLALLIIRKLEFARSMLWPLIAMMVLFFLMPMELVGGWGADHRLLIPLGLMLAGSLQPVQGEWKAWGFATGLIVALIVVRVTAISIEWRRANTEYGEYVRAFESLTNGSRVFFAFGHAGGQKLWPAPVYHLPLLAVMTKQVYLPYLFTAAGIPLRYRPDVEPLQRLSRGPVLMQHQSPNWSAIIDKFDYFFVVDEKFFDIPAPKDLVPAFKGDRVTVYKAPRK